MPLLALPHTRCLISALLGCILLIGCTPLQQTSHTGTSVTEKNLREQERQWLGTPFRRGGDSKRGIDASAFVMRIYEDAFGISLPRTTMEQVGVGKDVARKSLQSGDLLFFQTSASERHVGIYLGSGEFLHASSDYGVITSRLDEIYWQNTYWTARRVDAVPRSAPKPSTETKTETRKPGARRTGW